MIRLRRTGGAAPSAALVEKTLEARDGPVEIAVAHLPDVGGEKLVDLQALGGDGLWRAEEDLLHPGAGPGFAERSKRGSTGCGAIEEDDGGDLGVLDAIEAFEERGRERDGGLADGARSDGEAAYLGEELGGGGAKAKLVAVTDDGLAGRAVQDKAGVVGDVLPAGAGAGISECGFAGAGVAAEKDGAAFAGDTCGVNGSAEAVGEMRGCSSFKEEEAEVLRVGEGGGGDVDVRGALREVEDGVVMRVGDGDE